MNTPANAGDIEDAGSIPESAWPPGGGHGNHSSILAWRIPRTEEPGGLQSIGSQKVRHDWNDLAYTHTHTHTHTCHQTEIIIVQTLPKMEYQTSQPEITQSTTTWGAWLRDSYNPLKESNFAVTNLFFASCVNNFFQFPLACRILLYS